MSRKPTERELINELKSLPSDQDRIDRIAQDVDSGEDRYASINVDTLAELVGLSFEDTGDWGRSFLAFRRDIEDSGYEFPFAEHVSLLEGKIAKDRFKQLSALAGEILENGGPNDLNLRKNEITLLGDAYAEDAAEGGLSDLQLLTTYLSTTDGNGVEFQAVAGDWGCVDEASTPYALRDGEGLDTSEYIELSD